MSRARARTFLRGNFLAAAIRLVRDEIQWRKKRRRLVRRDPFLYK